MNRYDVQSFKRPHLDFIEVGQIWLNKKPAPDTPWGMRITHLGPRNDLVGVDNSLFWATAFWKTQHWFRGVSSASKPPKLTDEYVFTGGCGFNKEHVFRDNYYLAKDFKEKINDDGYVCSSTKGFYHEVSII